MRGLKSLRRGVFGIGLAGSVAVAAVGMPVMHSQAAPHVQAATLAVAAGQQARAQQRPAPARSQRSVQPAQTLSPAPAPSTAQLPLTERMARSALEERVQELGHSFPGEVGIAVRDIETGYVASWNGGRLFPQQSVSKFWVSLTTLDAVDRGRLDLDRRVTVTRDDLTLFSQPIAQQVDADGYTTTLRDLMTRAITRSDNTANDFLLWQAGGPEAVRAFISRTGIEGVRFGPGERLLQSQIAGVRWTQALSRGRAFYTARNAVPASTRRRLFEDYIEDPQDGASPLGLTQGLAMLQRGELLSPASTRHMISTLRATRTGPNRLAGGLAPGWTIGHKTGTGQVFNGTQAGYNDIGIITSPDGRHYALAVMIGRVSVPLGVRMTLMNNVTRAAIQYHDARR
ncbi:class A beta-lactamase [Sphingosinicella sp. YJ22]|uniref:class A beta-lactamase n=1 Tax=Sphingosinicella sp. YJ22 TaxID=1104780 RepID=UPI001FAEA2D6|nr:class A beta-lactamase [Sphingosinicella sp. YJ22]